MDRITELTQIIMDNENQIQHCKNIIEECEEKIDEACHELVCLDQELSEIYMEIKI